MTARTGDRDRTSTRARRVVVVALTLIGVAALVVAFRPGPSASSATQTTARLTTPFWSPRRLPGPFPTAVAAQRLQSTLDSAVGPPSCIAVGNASGLLAGIDADAATQLPGSTQKILTAFGAYKLLGFDSRFTTSAVATRAPKGGTLDRLYLVGGGDPLLSTPERAAGLLQNPETAPEATTSLAALADAIVAKGVRSIPGGIVADDSRYDAVRYSPHWPAHYASDRETGSIGALNVNRGFSAPAGDGAPDPDPAANTASQLARLLTDRGVAVGPVTRGVAPKPVVPIASVQSPPIRDVVGEMLRTSDNFTAEMLVKEMAVRHGRAGTTDNGIALIKQVVAGLGLPTKGWVMVDGSGLSRENRMPCRLLLSAITLTRTPAYAPIAADLAVAGRSGTLINRVPGSALVGNLRAKTGTLTGVTGLVGLIDLHGPLDFALLLNGGDAGTPAGSQQADHIAELLTGYPDAPSAAALVPSPSPPQTDTTPRPAKESKESK